MNSLIYIIRATSFLTGSVCSQFQTLVFELFFFLKITLSRRLWYARVGLYVTPIRFGLLSTLTANQITDSKCVSSE